jgi:hypothetical protein
MMASTGASRNRNLFAPLGMMISFIISFRRIGDRLQQAEGKPTRFGPMRTCM